MTAASPVKPSRSRHHKVAFACVVFVASMLGAAFACVPLYSMFCSLTGYGGKPRVALAAPNHAIDRTFTVRFDSNINGGLTWKFRPEAPTVSIKAGEVKTIYYRVTNYGTQPTYGLASYNVTPEETAPYFSKIQCFCFTSQTFAPGETRELPVVFFVDPAIAKDKALDDISTITLSYTFYPTKPPATPVAEADTPIDRTKL